MNIHTQGKWESVLIYKQSFTLGSLLSEEESEGSFKYTSLQFF